MDHEWKILKNGQFECRYNYACSCNVPNCGSCGWNPEVARSRLKEYIQKGEKKDERLQEKSL